jgi:proliferating cell nuclear antigen PCNA
MVNKKDCAVYLETIQTNVIKVLFESLKELLGDVNMVFTPEGVRICEIDDFETLMVDLFLDKDKLEDYYCPQTIEIGISIPNLYKVLKNMSNSNHLTMYMTHEDPSVLEIMINSDDTARKSEYTLNLMDLENENNLGFPDEEYTLTLKMNSSEFKQICQNTKSIETKRIKITYSKGIYTFSADGNIGHQKITHPADDMNDEDDPDSKSTKPNLSYFYEGIFDLEKLSSFTKCASITKKVKLYFENDQPVICEYELPCGDLNLMLSQINVP